MERINITRLVETDDGQLVPKVVGWFDADAAEVFSERQVFDGHNWVGAIEGSQWAGQTLYHTAGGRWVICRWSRWEGHQPQYAYLAPDEAREWLVANEHDEAVARIFGAAPEPEHGPGRPQIGRVVDVRMPDEMIAALDAEADRRGVPRAELVREFVAQALGMTVTT